MSWTSIAGFRIVTSDPERLTAFYAAIGFVIGDERVIAADEMRLLGLDGGGRRRIMTLGPSRLDLDWFEVQSIRGQIAEGAVAHWQVTVKLGFRIEA